LSNKNNKKEKELEYRRDGKRIADVLIHQFNVQTVEQFNEAYADYMQGSQQDIKFRDSFVLKAFTDVKQLPKEKASAGKVSKRKKTKKFRPSDYGYAGKQKGSSKIVRAVFDNKVKRYRNELGQFVRRIK